MRWDEVSTEDDGILVLTLADATQLEYDFTRLLLGRRMHLFVSWDDQTRPAIHYDVVVGQPQAGLDGRYLRLRVETIETVYGPS
jgi:hypothetical protein